MQFDPNIQCGSRVMRISLNDHDRLDWCSAKPLPSENACQWLDNVDTHAYAKFDQKIPWGSRDMSIFARQTDSRFKWPIYKLIWWFRLIDLSIDEGRGLMLWLLSAPPGLPVGFLLLWYSVLFTVESLSLLYLLFISWFICSRRWCIDKLGVYHTKQTSMCLDPHLN